MKLIFFITFNIFLIFKLNAQNSCDCAERIKQLMSYYYEKGDFSVALTAMKQSISYKGENANAYDYQILAYLYAENNQLDMVSDAILQAVERGMPSEKLKTDKFLKIREQLGDTIWQQLLKKVEIHRAIFKIKLDLNYFLAVEQLIGSDQYFRKFNRKATQEEYKLHDSLIFQKLQDLVKQYGYPNMKQHGFGDNTLEIFMLHYSVGDKKRLQEVVNLLNNANQEKNSGKVLIATLIDRYNMWGAQIPQSLGVWNSFKDDGKFSAISKVETIDNRRFKYNLLRLKEQAEKEKRELPEGYTPLSYPNNYFCGFPVKFIN